MGIVLDRLEIGDKPFDNQFIRAQLSLDRLLTITKGSGCNCGTIVGQVKQPRFLSSDPKIRKLQETFLGSEDDEIEEDVTEMRWWQDAISRLLIESAIEQVGLFWHDYEGECITEEYSIAMGDSIFACKINETYLRSIPENTVVKFERLPH